MDNKIEIEVTARDSAGMDYKVSHGGKFADGLTFDEMLGLVACLTMPESRRCILWMKTQEEWDEGERQLRDVHPGTPLAARETEN